MSLHDVPGSNAHMDTSPIPSPAKAMPQTFASIVPAHPDDSLLQNQLPQAQHDSLSIFSHPVDPATLHIPLSDTSPPSATLPPMDPLNPSSSTRAPPPGLLADFPPPSVPFTPVAPLDNIIAVHPPASTTPSSGAQTQPILNISSAFSLATTPALSTATTTMLTLSSPVPLTTAGSASSSSTLGSSGSDVPFSSLGGAAPSITQEPTFIYPPSDGNDACLSARDSSPDTPSDSPLMVVGGMLKSIAQTAQSASAACSLGQGFEAEARIDELKKTITLVSELIAATQIADPPSLSQASSPRRFSGFSPVGSTRNPTSSGSQDVSPSIVHFSPQDPGALDHLNSGDSSDLSRKRCASSIGGDRVQKALKREPQEDTPLHFIPAPATNPPVFPLSTVSSMTDLRSVPPFVSANTPQQPASRPTSSAGIPHPAFSMHAQPPSIPGIPIPLPATSAPTTSADFVSSSPMSTSVMHPSQFTPTTTTASSWSDGVTAVSQRNRQHSFSGSSFSNAVGFHSIPSTSATLVSIPFSSSGSFSTSPTQARPLAGGAGISPPIGRVSRSGSFTNNNGNTFTFGLPEVPPASGALDFLNAPPAPPVAAVQNAHSPTSSQEGEYENDSDYADPTSAQSLSPESSSGKSIRNAAQAPSSRLSSANNSRPGALTSRPSTENVPTSTSSASHGNEVPQEYRAEVDRIFFEFLNNICSNLEATDAKGEPIHQTLMAKKMQRLDESPDFRPFKFRIQAFTNAFLEELAKQGYPEEKIPMKKIRNYLWNQPYISRFNEEGKKTKSKGNHIWNIDARKTLDGGWAFRPFHRKVAGSPPGVAYVGLRWFWAPRIWDPQAPRTNLNVTYSSPSLPSWLTWEGDVLQGTPPPDAESCDITVEARFVQDGVEEKLSQTFFLNVAPVSTLDTAFPGSRRGSLSGDVHKPRRVSSDQSLIPPRSLRTTAAALAPPPSVATHDAQVMQVLTTAAQRVAQVAQSQVIAATNIAIDPRLELQALAKQQHVLTMTAKAFDQEVTGQRTDGPLQASTVLAAAAQQVVFQAARQVAADRSAVAASQISAGLPPPPAAVTVNEVSVATQSAVAQAVEITGPLSSEVDVLITASSLLQQQIRAPVSPPAPVLDPSQRALPMDTTLLNHSTTNGSAGSFPVSLATQTNTSIPFPPTVPLADFGRLC
ncbi:hypothetical protein V8B97DRAFT_1866663 [Scleroderma yunnanense]